MKYLKEFLEVAPFSLAIWRAGEAGVLSEAFVDIEPKSPLLDVGCGFGEFMGVFRPSIPGNKIAWGVDISPREIKLAARTGLYERLLCCDAKDLSGVPERFNTVLAVSVLEHIPGVAKVFIEVEKVLNPGGYFIYTVPTTLLSSPLWRLFFHPAFLHKSLYSPQGWQDLAVNSGLTVKTVVGTVTSRQLKAFEYGLPFAVPTQISRALLEKRLPFSPAVRVRYLEKLALDNLEGGTPLEANILVVAQKPL